MAAAAVPNGRGRNYLRGKESGRRRAALPHGGRRDPLESARFRERLSFRAQRCAKGGGTAHALPPPGTPARGPAERAVTGTAELKQRDRGVQIERQES